jgi:hypothetical protein
MPTVPFPIRLYLMAGLVSFVGRASGAISGVLIYQDHRDVSSVLRSLCTNSKPEEAGERDHRSLAVGFTYRELPTC